VTEQPHVPRRSDDRLWAIDANPTLGGGQPCTEEAWLGNRERAPRTDLPLEAEVHATHAVKALENGELDAGIAWLQSALAFAQNARHARENDPIRIVTGAQG
jgi:ABC-type Fe3+ transport system substrate-binding protein